MNSYKKILFLLCCIFSISSFAQIGKLEKANIKYDKYDYIDAREIYLKVVDNGYQSAEIYRKLGDTYYFNSEYSGAAKWYYNLISEFPDDATTTDYFRAAQCLKSIDQLEESKELMKIYDEKGGKSIALASYKNVADTLFKKGVQDKLFEIEKVAVNTAYSDFGPAFYGDSLIVFTSSGSAVKSFEDESADLSGWDNQPFLDLYQATLDGNLTLKNAEVLKGDINSDYHESTAVFTKDGNTMYFTRNNFIDGKKRRDKENVVRLKVYKATKIGDTWRNVKELPFNSDNYSVGHPALSPEEDKLYFASDMPGTLGMSDIWYVKILGDGIYSPAINMGEPINTVARETFPFVSAENNLYFSSEGHAGMGGLDIFVTKLTDESYEEIATFGEPINSSKDDFSFIIKEDRIGYFASNRDGDKGSVSDDIFQIWERCEITIEGPVLDETTGELIPNAIVTLLDSNNNELDKVQTGDDAVFSFVLECDNQYIIRAQKEGYNPREEIIETPKDSKTMEMPIMLNIPMSLKLADPCPPNDLGCRLTLQPIYFDYDKSNIRPDAEIELAKILVALNEYPQLNIYIESHTDSRGKDSYNLKLSERRAQSTLKWFFDHGINKSRLSGKGYGESQLINQCSNGVECTDQEHQLNRRSMFIIQE
ncbi:OmpA family protein [Bizionia arctica]|uniref:Cell envelope biogenesis protein OmpA n=1 Tax=Bizionia arctica TaxID=1495645 RepID=A0A917GR41_9FLAO|nr:OmpA family protein [Bizionia arctica]GGG54197.1 cell envelope biogenesis protein OmpA [Bizionia arctica]